MVHRTCRVQTSRQTGTLAKNTIVLDLNGLRMKHITNKRLKKWLSHPEMARADGMYPQSLGTMLITGIPGTLVSIFNNTVGLLLPKKVMEKIRITSKPAKEFEKLGIDLANVPEKFGGTMKTWPPETDSRREPP